MYYKGGISCHWCGRQEQVLSLKGEQIDHGKDKIFQMQYANCKQNDQLCKLCANVRYDLVASVFARCADKFLEAVRQVLGTVDPAAKLYPIMSFQLAGMLEHRNLTGMDPAHSCKSAQAACLQTARAQLKLKTILTSL